MQDITVEDASPEGAPEDSVLQEMQEAAALPPPEPIALPAP
jgi:hypothetical protein